MQFVVIIMATLGNECSIHLTVSCTPSVPRTKVYMGLEVGVESMAQTSTYVYITHVPRHTGCHTSQVNAVIE